MKTVTTILLILFALFEVSAQFAPPDGQPGTTAMHADSIAFIGWAEEAAIVKGLQDASDPSLGFAGVGDSSSCLGKADNVVVSLGDGGSALITLKTPIYDGPSWDFAVFENSFVNNFLELAFVEVSSDGQDFYRFPAASLTQDTSQIGAFDFIDATKINNLAGKYRGGFGTPFNLSELSHHNNLDIQNIGYIKIIDVVGSILDTYGSKDTSGRFINDPWPTAFASSGFDLDAIGFIHIKGIGLKENSPNWTLYPNPSQGILNFEHSGNESSYDRVEVYNLMGSLVLSITISSSKTKLDLTSLNNGSYIFSFSDKNGLHHELIRIVK
jgi:hypothetical protein